MASYFDLKKSEDLDRRVVVRDLRAAGREDGLEPLG
jgi:hypothetical protein